MIRFNCPNCGRRYELPDLMAHLPLLCKGCAQPLAVPEPTPEPEPEPLPVTRPRPAKAEPASERKEKPADLPARKPAAGPEPTETVPVADEFPVTKPDSPPIDFHSAGPKPDATAMSPAPTPRSGGSKLLPVIADLAVGLVLLALGVFLGEILAQKSTREVLSEAGSSAKFPPLELIQWLGPPLLFGLVYAMLASRGISVGGWLKRRSG